MDPHLLAFSSGSMESDLPAIDVVDHTQSELPNLDGGSFDLAGSNHGNLPESDSPANDVVDHTQSELPNLDGGIFDLAGSNHGNLPDLSQPLAASAANRLQEFVDEATGVDNLSCYDFSRLPECEFASVGEFGRRHKKRTNKADQAVVRLASK